MTNDAIQLLGEGLFVLAVIIVLGLSVAFALRQNQAAADANRQKDAPISNGLVIPATVVLVIVLLLALIIGFLPPILRRG